jgi:hypothetical protein
LPEGATVTTTFSGKVTDTFNNLSSVSGVTLSTCGDCPCPSGLNPGLGSGTTDDAGQYSYEVSFTVGTSGLGLNSCTELTSDAGGLIPTLEYNEFPLSQSLYMGPSQGFVVETLRGFQALAQTAGYTIDPSRSLMVAAGINDCLGFPAAGVALSIDVQAPNMVPFYGTSADALQRKVTDQSGSAGFFNVPVESSLDDGGASGAGLGSATLTATFLGRPVARVTVVTQAGTATTPGMAPGP